MSTGRAERYAAVIVEGERHVHANGSNNGTYATLCGLDGDDREQSMDEVRPGEKITCAACRAIWVEAKRYRKTDFA